MENKDKPAFPAEAKLQGLTKREKIAAMAMQGILANHWCQNEYGNNIHALGHEHAAKQAVGYADALLKELEK
jgi:hypothetical protein